MLAAVLWFCAGLVLLTLGADSFLKGSSSLAQRFGVSPFVVGLTVVAFGTSAPELAVNVSAVLNNSYDLSLGNVVGSNIVNIGLILGLSALIAPLAVHMRLIRVEVPLLIGVSLFLLLLSLDGEISRVDAAFLLFGFATMMIMLIRDAPQEPTDVRQEVTEAVEPVMSIGKGLALTAAGLVGLVVGSDWMVDGAVVMARMWGLSELVIGLTVVAIGTSLPELASSLIAAMRGQSDIAVGNVVGSNLFNILLILGATSAIHPLPVASSLLHFELPVMLGLAVILWPIIRTRLTITRAEGGLLLGIFVVVLAVQVGMAVG